MKILSAEQVRQADQHTIDHEPISSIDLMERAASACTDEIIKNCPYDAHFTVICGKGNNGCDGLAIARMLYWTHMKVNVFIVEHTEKCSKDYAVNLDRLKQIPDLTLHHITRADELFFEQKNSIIIDAILGSGINKPTEGLIAEVIEKTNKAALKVIAIDVPSGLLIDAPTPAKSAVMRAETTLTFQQPKLAFMLPESGEYVGRFQILDIKLDQTYIEGLLSPYYFLQSSDLAPFLLDRSKFAHKGTFGHALLMAGAYGRMGAAVLAAQACLRSGCGLLTTHIPACGYQIMQTSLPEAMVSGDVSDKHISALPKLDNYNSIGIGPGIGTDAETAKTLKLLIQEAACPLVLDADALNILGENKTWLGFLPPRSILTPHPKEFDRLTQIHTNSWERLKSAQQLAHKHSLIIVLKGAHTAIVMPDKSVWFNSSGNPAMAKGGSGDVLTGMTTALLSRGYSPRDAVFLAVHLHGLTADTAIRQINTESLIASDLIAHISAAFTELYKRKNKLPLVY